MEHAPAAERRIIRRATVAREPGFAIGTGAPGMDCCGGLFPGRTGGGPESWYGERSPVVRPFVRVRTAVSWDAAVRKPWTELRLPGFCPAVGGRSGRTSVVPGGIGDDVFDAWIERPGRGLLCPAGHSPVDTVGLSEGRVFRLAPGRMGPGRTLCRILSQLRAHWGARLQHQYAPLEFRLRAVW